MISVRFKGSNPPKISYFVGVFAERARKIKLIIPKGTLWTYSEAEYPMDNIVEE